MKDSLLYYNPLLIIPNTEEVMNAHTHVRQYSNKHMFIAYKVQMSLQEGSTVEQTLATLVGVGAGQLF